MDRPYESRLEWQARQEKKAVRILGGLVALMFLWSAVKVFLPKGHIDTMAKAKALHLGMPVTQVKAAIGDPDKREQNFRFCGNEPASYHAVYFDNRDRNRLLRVCYDENDCVDWIKVEGREGKPLLELELDQYSHDGG